MTRSFLVILFHTTNHVLRAEKALKRADLTLKIVPVPRHLSSDCGVSIRIPEGEREAAVAALDEAELEVAGIHPFARS